MALTIVSAAILVLGKDRVQDRLRDALLSFG